MANEILDLLSGKNTIEAAHILSEAFVNRFGMEHGSGAEIVRKLLPKGKASSWSMLDRNINLFCRQFYDAWEEGEDKVDFWDHARFALNSLPMRQDYKLSPDKERYPSSEEAARNFVMCSLCWRTVFRWPLEKKAPLCHLHDLPSSSSEYRKRMRMKKRAEANRLALIKSMPPLTCVKRELEAEPSEYLQAICLNENGPLPKLAKYLHALSLPLATGTEIMRALEHPIYWDRISPFMAQTWEYYLADRGRHFKLSYVSILTAEAWLQAEEKYRHGGRRR